MPFAVSLLFGLRDGLSVSLLDRRRKAFDVYALKFRTLGDDGAAVLDAIQRRGMKRTELCDGIKKLGRTFGILAAIATSIVMLVMGDEQTVRIWPETVVFGILSLPVPLVCLEMFFVHHAFSSRISFADIVKKPDDSKEADRVLGSFR